MDVSHDWHDIGLALRMSSGTLDSMRGPYKGPRDCMKDMLKEWLNTSPDPSWKGLMEALRHPVVGKPYLAMQLEAKYLTQGESESPIGNYVKVVFHRIWGDMPTQYCLLLLCTTRTRRILYSYPVIVWQWSRAPDLLQYTIKVVSPYYMYVCI